MKKCNSCNNQVQDSFNFCPSCGGTNFTSLDIQSSNNFAMPNQQFPQQDITQSNYVNRDLNQNNMSNTQNVNPTLNLFQQPIQLNAQQPNYNQQTLSDNVNQQSPKKKLSVWKILLIILGIGIGLYVVGVFVIGSTVTNNVISQAREGANKSTVSNFARQIENEYMKSIVLNSKLEWVDYNSGKINFDKLDSKALIPGAKVVCSNNSYIDANGKVVLKDCKVEDYTPKYNYENGNVTSDAKIK